jgi:hypothetical protein
MGIRPE